MSIRIKVLLEDELQQALAKLKLSEQIEEIEVVRPDKQYGDYATNLPMRLAKKLKEQPASLAEKIHQLLLESVQFNEVISQTIFAGGFLNFTLRPEFLAKWAQGVLAGDDFGYLNIGHSQKVNVEFISANPTGPLTLHNIRGGVVGDVLSNVLEHCGYLVTREYYVNDAGHQVEILGLSALASVGLVPDEEEYYHGSYVGEWAEKNKDWLTDHLTEAFLVGQGLAAYLLEYEIKPVISNGLGINYDLYFSEWQELHEKGVINSLFEEFKKTGVVYEKEGAWWLSTTKYGDDQDRVIKKSDGQFTYFLADIAYHLNKLARGASKTIYVLGADHHGHTTKLNAALQLIKQAPADFILIQMMTVLEGEKEIRMSKRAGRFITMKDLLDKVPADVIRFFTLRYTVNSAMHFNLQEALDQTEKNPVYYLQYAYARVHQILEQDKVKEVLANKKINEISLEEASLGLLKEILAWPDILVDTAESYHVHQLSSYALAVADNFHRFYDQLRIIEKEEVRLDRLGILLLVEKALSQIMTTMGITVKEKM